MQEAPYLKNRTHANTRLSSGWLSNKLKSRGRILSHYKDGCALSDKTRILVASFISQVPKSLRNRSNIFNKMVNSIINGVKINRFGFTFYLTALDDLLHTHQNFENEIKEWFQVKKDEVFLDVGANIGRYSILMAKKVKQIFSFEPSSRTFLALVRNIKINNLENVHPFPFALWNKDGIETLYIKERSGLSSLITKDRCIREEKIRTKTLDGLINALQIERIDLVKIDVEDSEKKVLEGMSETLQLFKPRLIIEVKKNNKEWIDHFLQEIGYTMKTKEGINRLYLWDGQC